MFRKAALLAFAFLAVANGQGVGTYQAEKHPALPFQRCTKSGGCTTVSTGQIVLDANWRWLHDKGGYTNCYTGNTWNATACPDNKTCARNCVVDGADYSATYGITTSGNALTLKFVTSNGSGKNIGSRVYLMSSDSKYENVNLVNREFTFDVDVSNLPCGLNGALYFSEMDADGGTSKYSTNTAGAKYGTGYCDSQCPKDIKFINGEANVEGWKASATDANGGTGRYGTCCNEMDIWEANKISTAFTPHPCTVTGPTRCDGSQCNTSEDRYGGVCDPDGCDFNSYRMGDKNFYGPGKVLDTTKKMTVVTQFLTDTGTDSGKIVEMKRFYVQDGKVYANSWSNVPGLATYNSVSDKFCSESKTAFGDRNAYQEKGAMAEMERGFRRGGYTLALSIWDDHFAHMLWLDSTYPTDKDPNQPGIARGSCSTSSGDPKDIESADANASVTFSNIKFGEIGSTFPTTTPIEQPKPSGGGGTSSTSSTTTTRTTTTTQQQTTTTTAGGATQTPYGQCGGRGYTGPTNCSGSTCQVINTWYSQCIP